MMAVGGQLYPMVPSSTAPVVELKIRRGSRLVGVRLPPPAPIIKGLRDPSRYASRVSSANCAGSRILCARERNHATPLDRRRRTERRQLAHSLGQVGLVDDAVAIKDAP